MLYRRRYLPDLDRPSLFLFGSSPEARSRAGLARLSGPGSLPRVLALALAAMLPLAPGARTAEQTTQDAVPEPATLVYPTDGTSVPAGRENGVALAWRPQRPADVWYFVEVVELVSSERKDAFTGYTRQTALRVRLDDAGQYAWRVLAVNRASAHYSVSPWSSFTVSGGAR
jgi:hypothetical protein